MSEREQRGLRGPVKSCTEERTYPGGVGGDGREYPEFQSENTTEYDIDGRVLSTRSRNSDGTYFVTRYSHDDSGRLLNVAHGTEGQALEQMTYSYDQQGRLQKISDASRPDNPVIFRYDQQGRRTEILTSRAADYRPGIAEGGSPFEIAQRAPNLPGGGSATTVYDEHDRPTEVQVRDTEGELVSRAVRVYDAQGHIVEERRILENLAPMIPADVRAQMLEQSGLSAEQLRQELTAQLTKLMAGPFGVYSVSYSYDAHGRLSHTTRRIFNHLVEIEATYNEYGDVESEITRRAQLLQQADPTAPAPTPNSYSELRYSYHYDQHENWIEKLSSYRSSPDGTFQSQPVIKRTLTYY
jgi:YD repeat-containing protein